MTQTIINLGTGGAALNGQNGSTAGADSNDALFLDWPGDNQGNYVYLPGVVGNGLVPATTNESGYQPTGDFTISVYCAADDWTPATAAHLVSRRLSGTLRSYWFTLNTTGTLSLVTSSNGTADTTASTSTVAVPAVNGQALWVRCTMQLDNGASGNTVTFYTSLDGVTWTQLGDPRINAGVTTIHDPGTSLVVGAQFSNASDNNFSGKIYRAIVADGLHTLSVPFLDVDCSKITSGSAASLVSSVGSKTFNILRSTAGRKSVAVVSPVWLFGADDYMEVADNALLNFTGNQDFTVLFIGRIWDTPRSFGGFVTKQFSSQIGWTVLNESTNNRAYLTNCDSTGESNSARSTPAYTLGGATVMAFQRNTAATQMSHWVNVVQSVPTTGRNGDLTNTLAVRIGRQSGAATAYHDFEMVGVAVFRRLLSTSEIANITSYYQARLS